MTVQTRGGVPCLWLGGPEIDSSTWMTWGGTVPRGKGVQSRQKQQVSMTIALVLRLRRDMTYPPKQSEKDKNSSAFTCRSVESKPFRKRKWSDGIKEILWNRRRKTQIFWSASLLTVENYHRNHPISKLSSETVTNLQAISQNVWNWDTGKIWTSWST